VISLKLASVFRNKKAGLSSRLDFDYRQYFFSFLFYNRLLKDERFFLTLIGMNTFFERLLFVK